MNIVQLSKILDIEPGSSEAESIEAQNADLPRVNLVAEGIAGVFASRRDELHVIGDEEARMLTDLLDLQGFTSFEVAAVLVADIDKKSTTDAKVVASDLLFQGSGLIGALEQSWEISDRRLIAGLAEARIVLEDLIPNPVVAAPGTFFIDALMAVAEG